MDSELSKSSVDVGPRRQYAPKTKTAPFEFLKILNQLGQDFAFVPLSKIKQQYYARNGTNLKLRIESKDRLNKNGYTNTSLDLVQITQKAKDLIHAQQHSPQDDTVPAATQKGNDAQQLSCSSFNRLNNSSKGRASSSKETADLMKLYVNREYPRSGITSKFEMSVKEGEWDLRVLVSAEQIRQREERRLIKQKVSAIAKVQFYGLELTDFAWTLNGNMLDYLVLRVRLDCYDDAEYKIKCIRAKASGSTNVTILLEQNYATMTQHQIHHLAALTRVYGLKVVRTRSFEDSCAFIGEVTSGLMKEGSQLSNNEKVLTHFGPVERFVFCNRYTRYTKLQRITSTCMSCFGFGKDTLLKFARKYPTFKLLHDKLHPYPTQRKKAKAISYLFRSEGLRPYTLQLLVHFLFNHSYSIGLSEWKEETSQQRLPSQPQ